MNNLPTHKKCPECGGSGEYNQHMPDCYQCPTHADCDKPYTDFCCIPSKCEICNGTGEVPIFYTPDQYKKITGKDYPDDTLVWGRRGNHWDVIEFKEARQYTPIRYKYLVIVQTAQSEPPPDYRPEE